MFEMKPQYPVLKYVIRNATWYVPTGRVTWTWEEYTKSHMCLKFLKEWIWKNLQVYGFQEVWNEIYHNKGPFQYPIR